MVQGDETTINKYSHLISIEDARKFIDFVEASPRLSQDTRTRLKRNTWRTHYRSRPPTPQEFCTEEWIGPTARNLYPWIPKALAEFWNPQKSCRHLFLSTGIGAGKSLMSALCSLYHTILLWSMRDMKQFFQLSHASSITFMLMSFTKAKVDQLLVSPFLNILKSSEKFRRVRLEESMANIQKNEKKRICWTTSGRIGPLQFSNNLHYAIGSSVDDIYGLTYINVILSEISFFISRGYSPEHIWGLYIRNKLRIQSRFGNNYFARTIVDSSPNDINYSPIDNYIFSSEDDYGRGRAFEDDTNLIFTGPQWQYIPKEKYAEHAKTGETFCMFRGSEKELPKIVSDVEKQTYRPVEVYNVPIDLKTSFVEDPVASVKDMCGWPAGGDTYFIPSPHYIEAMFHDDIPNFYSFFYTERIPTLHEEIEKLCFTTDNIMSRPVLKTDMEQNRFMHIDLSEVSNDACAISVCHPVYKDHRNYIVFDFTLCIAPKKMSKMNMNEFLKFFDKLISLPFNIKKVTYDSFQKSVLETFLESKGIDHALLSVDRTIDPYEFLRDKIISGLVKVGKNIVLKNNLKSLKKSKMRIREKIDHTKGTTKYSDSNLDWNTSFVGKHAKDLSDSICGAIVSCCEYAHYSDFLDTDTAQDDNVSKFLMNNALA